MSVIWITILLLAAIGMIAAILLYLAAKKFYVYEDPRIAKVEELLPGANCGSCGFSGCHAFAVACCTASSLENIHCPATSKNTMFHIGEIVGLTPGEVVPKLAVTACAGACGLRPLTSHYDGVRSCALEAAAYAGTTACAYGCLGGGDCVDACPYDALVMDTESGLPAVNYELCVGCGRCVDACPRHLMQLVPKRKPRVWVACSNHDKGGVAMKECDVACIGCGKCVRVCQHKAITVKDFVAHIDQELCIACGDCMEVCPRHSILANQIINKEQA